MKKLNLINYKKEVYFSDFDDIVKEIKQLIDEGRLVDVIIGFRFQIDPKSYRIGYYWRGKNTLTSILGILEYLKMLLYEKQGEE